VLARGSVKLAPLAISLLLAACATSWDRTREQTVQPIHDLLHHTYAEALQSRDPAQLTALFVSAEAARAPSLELQARFSRIETARVAIERVEFEASPLRASLRLRLEGVDTEGRRATIDQDKQVTVVRAEDTEAGWRIASDEPGPVRAAPVPSAHFENEALRRGLWFRHESAKVPDAKGEPQRFVYGSGVAAPDVDGNGWADVILLTGDRVELFLNEGGYFSRASEAWGLGVSLGRVLTVALPADFDGDGRPDLFVGAEHAQPLMLRNDGARFVPVVDTGIETEERTISATAADYDGNGTVDLFLANHDDVFHNAPDPPGSAENAKRDQLFLNDGGWRFRDVTRRAGVDNRGWSLAPVSVDYDQDGDVDIFVGNDFGPDAFYRNDGSGRFEEVSDAVGLDQPVAAMSADWGDFDSDGDFDLFVGGMRSGSGWVLEVPDFRVRRVPRVVDMMFRPYVREAIRSWFRGNRFYENLGDGTFREIAATSGAQDSGWAWGHVWLDFDNDGLLDLYGLNGFISGNLKDDV
jgi:hypothetical protein